MSNGQEGGMTTEVTLAALGASVTEGTVIRWFKGVGDPVEADEPLLEVSTDKVDTEIPAPVAGTLATIHAGVDETVQIGTPLATIAGAETDVSPAPTAPEPTPVEPTTRSVARTVPGPPSAAQSPRPTRPTTPAEATSPATAALAPRSDSDSGRTSTAPAPLRGQTVKLTRLRKVIAERMVESLQRSAQLTQVVEVDITNVARLRDAAKDDFQAREHTKLTYLPFFARATLDTLQQHPALNARIDLDSGEVTYHDRDHLAIAVDTDRGLYTPVLKDAGAMSIAELAKNIADVAGRTRTNKITLDELSGGTFTITNLGSFGALFDTPIINQPQVAILAPGAVTKRPVVLDDPHLGETIAVRHMVYLALTYDHRLIDGADAGRFLRDVKTRLEAGQFSV
jgi:pyruvate dehydrogenase E2 component (dihydrolipoamide acetyltransferase)